VSVSAQEAAQVAAIAAAHQQTQTAITAAQIAAAIEVFRLLDPDHPIASWIHSIGQRIFVLTSTAQELMASQASQYAHDVLAAQGIDIDIPTLDARAFAGIASDGRGLEGLLAGAAIRTSAHLNHGDSVANSMRSGEAWLRMAMVTQIADAARAADSVPIAVGRATVRPETVQPLTTVTVTASDLPPQPASLLSPASPAPKQPRRAPRGPATRPAPKEVSLGYIRVLDLPSCGRCAVLAGRWYRWNAGFARHPGCDCKAAGAAEPDAPDFTTDPKAYFNSLSKEDQEKYFGKAEAQAIRDGADIGRVVNAHRKGATFTADNGHRYTRAGTGRKKRGQPPVLRPTVWQIYRDAKGDRETARKMLRQYSYLLA